MRYVGKLAIKRFATSHLYSEELCITTQSTLCCSVTTVEVLLRQLTCMRIYLQVFIVVSLESHPANGLRPSFAQAGCKVVSLESHPANALRASAAHSGRMQGSIS